MLLSERVSTGPKMALETDVHWQEMWTARSMGLRWLDAPTGFGSAWMSMASCSVLKWAALMAHVLVLKTKAPKMALALGDCYLALG